MMTKKLNREALAETLPGYLPKGSRPKCATCDKELPLAFMVPLGSGTYCNNYGKDRAVAIKFGVEGDGFFCTKQCGYIYGVVAARSRAVQRGV